MPPHSFTGKGLVLGNRLKSVHQRTHPNADVIRPNHKGKHTPPKRQVHKPNRKQPRRTPKTSAKKRMPLHHLDLLHRLRHRNHLLPAAFFTTAASSASG